MLRKPTDNAYIEAFNGKFRAECLNAHSFMGLHDTAKKFNAWRRDYNAELPHSSSGNNVLATLMKSADLNSQPADQSAENSVSKSIRKGAKSHPIRSTIYARTELYQIAGRFGSSACGTVQIFTID